MKRATLVAICCAILMGCGQNQPEGDQQAPTTTSPAVAQPTNFETWIMIGDAEVRDAAAAAPDGSQSADVLVLDSNEGVAWRDDGTGANVTAAATLWSDSAQSVALQLVNWCRPNNAEVETMYVILTPEPTEHELSRTFQNAADCVRFQIILVDSDRGEVSAWNPRFSRR